MGLTLFGAFLGAVLGGFVSWLIARSIYERQLRESQEAKRDFDRQLDFLAHLMRGLNIDVRSILAGIMALKQAPALGMQEKVPVSVQSLPSPQVEQLVARLFRAMGYRVTSNVTIGGNEYDLVLDKDGKRTVVEVKATTGERSVDAATLWTFLGRAHRLAGHDELIVVTTSRCTKEAAEIADQHKITLWDREVLGRLLAKYQVQ